MAHTRGVWQRTATVSLLLATILATIVATSEPTTTDALPPPLGRASHGAAGTARNGFGGEIAPSPTGESWPGTGSHNNGGPFAFAGAQYGPLWNIPAGTNNSRGVGYCVMEDVTGEGVVSLRPDPAVWSDGESARAAALMATFGGDRVVPYGINDAGALNVITGEWENPLLFGGGEFTRRRQVAVNFGIRMFLEDLSPHGVAGGRKLARDAAVINGAGGEFAALSNGYRVAQYMARVADRQSALGGVRLKMVWGTPGGAQPTVPGTYPLEVHVTDGTGKQVGLVPVLQLSGIGIDDNRSSHAVARVDNRVDAAADIARWNAATASGWPVWGMNLMLNSDRRFTVGSNAHSADVADGNGIARFNVEITGAEWELAFHVQAPPSNVDLYAGSGIQGQVTWSGRPQSASVYEQFVVPDRFVTISKTSSDTAVAVTGTVFGLYDGSRDEIEQATVRADGRASFNGFSPAVFEPPYVLRELSAAPGLESISGDITVPALPLLSTDGANPTVVDVLNTASTGRFRVRKVLDDVDVQGARDMAGFTFRITQVVTGLSVGEFTTGSDGLTPFIEAVLGEYKIVEVARPSWAEALIDPGPTTFHFDPTAAVAEITYTNLVPDVEIRTRALDPMDGDKFVVLTETDGPTGSSAALDVVSYCGLIPGTEYAVSGEIQVIADDATPIPSGVTGSTTFVPSTTCGDVEVAFEVPAESSLRGHVAVVFEKLTLTSTGAILAEHTDPADEDQMLFFPSIRTDLHGEKITAAETEDQDSGGPASSDRPADVDDSDSSTDSDDPGDSDRSTGPGHHYARHMLVTGARLGDVVTYSGLAPGEPYRAELTLYERGLDGQCEVTRIVASKEFTPTGPQGAVIVTGVNAPAPGVYVGYERIYRVGEKSDDLGDGAPEGAGAGIPDDTDRGGDVLVAAHEDCDDQRQTVWTLGMETAAAQSTVTGAGEMSDTVTVSGLADGLPEGVMATVEGSLHRHTGPDRSKWVCDLDNRVAQFTLGVDTDRDYRSPGERHGIGWYSYDNRFVFRFADGTTWESERFGCTVEAESFEARAPDRPPTPSAPPAAEAPPISQAPPAAPPRPEPPTITAPPPQLPRTGGSDSGRVQLMAILLVLAGGALFLVTPASPLPRRRRFRDLCQRISLRQR